MKIRQVNTSEADRASAKVFFAALAEIWDLSEVRALDAFARNGQLTVSNYIGRCAAVDAWELSPVHVPDLIRLGVRSIASGCSYVTAEICQTRYDMVVVDTPQGIHTDHDGNECVEHFRFLEFLPKLLRDTGLVVLYVNKKPYNREDVGDHGYDQYESYDFSRWMERRALFYGTAAPSEATALAAYRIALSDLGLTVKRSLLVPCHSDVPGLEPYAFRVALEVARA